MSILYLAHVLKCSNCCRWNHHWGNGSKPSPPQFALAFPPSTERRSRLCRVIHRKFFYSSSSNPVMGTYLSTPVTDKCEESGESLDCPDVPCAWGVVDMQGWRKSMEDGHTAVTDIPLVSAYRSDPAEASPEDDPASSIVSDAKVFAVFDGHGGPEVARFCQLYLVSVLQQQPTWKGATLPTTADSPTIPPPDDQEAAGETPVGRALRDSFHGLDRMINDPARRYAIVFHSVSLSRSRPSRTFSVVCSPFGRRLVSCLFVAVLFRRGAKPLYHLTAKRLFNYGTPNPKWANGGRPCRFRRPSI